MKDHSLLVERYRPKTLNEYVGNEHIKKQIQKYIDQNDIQILYFMVPLVQVKLLLLNLSLLTWTAIIFTLTLLTNVGLKLLGIKSPTSQVLLRLERLKLSFWTRRISSQFKLKHR